MPQYKVISPGFFNGELYSPEGKRSVLNTPKPFTKKNPMPSWLSEMPKESDAAKAKREKYEASQKAADEASAEQQKKDIKEASFLGEGESGNAVETL